MTTDQDSRTDLELAAETRLVLLRRQLAEGEAALAEHDGQREQLVANLLRLSGAIQVLTELLAPASEE
ncbi:hypothetical protein [Microbacterium sp. SSM24]|uniref:hypothetical protein n=1 Tax=Microbacterium sp. SSM24 TaxID=2991714 RepID=UPI00222659FC|nr:hypothetical protein [Microbacterium sp. SSM24]MCW3494223.1 hypothetical protein [Microbacterium sp. SSM24]